MEVAGRKGCVNNIYANLGTVFTYFISMGLIWKHRR